MPPKVDYNALGRLLAAPEAWDDQEAESARALLQGLREAIGGVQPEEQGRRASMEKVASQVEVALARWERTR